MFKPFTMSAPRKYFAVVLAVSVFRNVGLRRRWGSRFSAPVQTGLGGPPDLLYYGYRLSFLGIKRPGRGVKYQPPSIAEVKERVELYLYFPSSPSWQVSGSNSPLQRLDCVSLQ